MGAGGFSTSRFGSVVLSDCWASSATAGVGGGSEDSFLNLLVKHSSVASLRVWGGDATASFRTDRF